MHFEKKLLGKIAQEQGFVRDTLEKVYRLSEILKYINSNPDLKECLALKGGTAINLTIFNLPRLSVDIDLDYSKDVDRENMLADREIITADIQKFMSANEYELSPKSRSYHTLDGFVYSYINTAGVQDNIKIEINYSMRIHIFPLIHRTVETDGLIANFDVLSVTGIEIFGSKIKALLDRGAARDLYDVNNMIRFGLFEACEMERLKKCALFYMAVGNDIVPQAIDTSAVDAITYRKIHTDLNPVKRKKENFNLEDAKKNVTQYLQKLMTLTEDEKGFLYEFSNKNYCPELLFEDEEILERLRKHPMAKWKMSNN